MGNLFNYLDIKLPLITFANSAALRTVHSNKEYILDRRTNHDIRNKYKLFALFVSISICSISRPSIAAELELKQEKVGPSYEETIAFLRKYPKYEGWFFRSGKPIPGYKMSNLRVEDCILKYDYNTFIPGGLFTDDKYSGQETNTASLPLKNAVVPKEIGGINGKYNLTYINYAHSNGNCCWNIYFLGDTWEGGITERYKKAIDHLLKLCGANEKTDPF
jgi:hypothetical protein